MKINSLILFSCLAIFAFACKTKQKTAVNDAPTPPAMPPAAVVIGPVRPTNGVYEPGAAEVAAIQAQFAGTTQAELLEGYKLYTGTCTNCHQPKNIYNRPENRWPGIISDMSMRSHLTAQQSDAILKYVLSVKASQPK
jgi:hypothetical protein